MQFDLLTGSIILNILLILLFIFKSAVNEIVKDIWISSQQSKKEKQERLLDLKEVTLKFKETFNKLADYAYAINTGNKQLQEVFNKQPNVKLKDGIFDSSNRYISLMPVDVQNAYKSVIDNSSTLVGDILFNNNKNIESYSELQKIKVPVNEEYDRVVILIEDYLTK